MNDLRLSEIGIRVMYGALSLPSFTIEQLASYSGVNSKTVQTTVTRSSHLIEPVGRVASEKKGGRAIVYSLRKEARKVVAAKVTALARTLNGPSQEDPQIAVRGALDAVEALESSIRSSHAPKGTGTSAETWKARATRQLTLSKNLINRLPENLERSQLQERLKQASEKLSPQQATLERTPHVEIATGEWVQLWDEFLSFLRRAGTPGKGYEAPQLSAAAGYASYFAAPAAVLRAPGDLTLAPMIASELRESHRLTLQADLGGFVSELREKQFRAFIVHMLELSPKDTSVIVTLDSSKQDSHYVVGEFLDGMQDVLWSHQPPEPLSLPQVTLIDFGISSDLVRRNYEMRNIHYLPNITDRNSVATVTNALTLPDQQAALASMGQRI
jgi:hypothetical protein